MEKGKTAQHRQSRCAAAASPPLSAAQSMSSPPLLRELAGVTDSISKAGALVGLYEKHANSGLRSQAELEEVQREMKIIKSEILSELMRARGILQRLQKDTGLQGLQKEHGAWHNGA